MFTAMFKKEWYKIRRIWYLPFLLMLGALSDYYLSLQGFRLTHGSNELWFQIIYKETIFFESIKWVFLFAAIWFAAFQLVPECSGRRLRLLFHLPMNHHYLFFVIVGTGLGLLSLLFIFTSAGFWFIACKNGFPTKMTWLLYLTIIPYFLIGITSWCSVAATIAEPTLLRKICLALTGYGFFVLLTSSRGFAALELSTYTLICIPWLFALNASALRIKEGD